LNCPHYHRISAAEPRSYRDLPLRLTEYGTNYRYEQSGELFGLKRVRLRSKGNVGAKPKAEVGAELLARIRERRA
jgi:hypothetical protein